MKRLALLVFLTLQVAVLMSAPRARRSRSHHVSKTRHSVMFFAGHNSFTVETSTNIENNAGVLTISHPSFLVRYGLLSILEFRLNVDVTTIKDMNTGISKTGIMPLQPGLKVKLNQPRKFLPSFSFTASVILPKASTSNMRQTYYGPYLIASAEQDITKKLSFEYAAGLQWDADNFHRIYSTTINFEYDVRDLSTFYGDVYVFKEDGNPFDVRADIGFNETINSNLQFDFSSGAGFTSGSPEFFLSAGLFFSVQGKGKGKAVHATPIPPPLNRMPVPVR